MDRLITEVWHPETRRNTELVIDSDTGLPLIIHTQDTKPIVEQAKRLSNNYDRHAPNPHGWTLVARVPAVVWAQWRRLGITQDEKALNAALDMRECADFRTDGRRRLS